jgi:hypothetical protein
MRHMRKVKGRIKNTIYSNASRLVYLLSCSIPIFCIAGCGSNAASGSASAPQYIPQNYFAPYVFGATYVDGVTTLAVPQQYTFDHSVNVFQQSTFQLSPPQNGAQVLSSGTTSASPRGLLDLTTSVSYEFSTSGFTPVVPTTPTSGWAVELAGQAGGLVQLPGQPVMPLVAANQCPNLATAQPYQFLTIPGAIPTTQVFQGKPGAWTPATQAAYGSVDISSSGIAVYFNNIKQFTLPSVGGTGTPALPGPTSVTGACAPTFFGSTINLPGQLVITDPTYEGGPVTAQGTVGIGPSGLLVEDNSGAQNLDLGAGTGAIGLPTPASQVDTGMLVAAQYLGFIYGAGIANNTGVLNWSSHVASFGFSTPTPTSCPFIVPSTTTAVMYGGDFSQNNGQDNPSASPSGYGNSDFAIDLGTQDASNNGLYRNATVWICSGYAANTTKAAYHFPAVAIAGLLQGKFAVFVLGVDPSQQQPWEISLLQSN